MVDDWGVTYLYMSLMLLTEHALCFLDMCAVKDDFKVNVLLQPVTGHATGLPSISGTEVL